MIFPRITASPACCCSFQAVKKVVADFLSAVFRRTLEPLIGYFLKICVFREAALQGRFGRWVVLPLTAKIGNTWLRCRGFPAQFTTFGKKRLEESSEFLAPFGETRTLVTADGVEIKWTFYSAEKFRNSPEVLAGFKLNAAEVPKRVVGAEQKCVLRCNGFGLPIETDKRFIGLHLAAGFNYAVFEWRKEASIEGFFKDADAAYQAVLDQGFTAPQIKVLGYCGSNYVAAHLKEKHHSEGLDLVMIGPHTSLRDVVAHTQWPANRIGLLGLGAIEKNGLDFHNLKKFQTLDKSGAATCLIMNPNNEIAPPRTVERLQEALVKCGNCELILKPEGCSDEEFNFNKQFQIPEIWQRYVAFLSRSP